MIHIQLDSQRAQQKLGQIARQLEKPDRLYRVIGETLIRIHQKRFDKEESPNGERWKPLASWYKAQKRQGSKILQGRGYLRNTLAYNAYSNRVEFGSSVKYAGLHQFGGTIKPKHKKILRLGDYGFAKKVVVPARPWLGLNQADEDLLERKAIHLISQTLRNTGR